MNGENRKDKIVIRFILIFLVIMFIGSLGGVLIVYDFMSVSGNKDVEIIKKYSENSAFFKVDVIISMILYLCTIMFLYLRSKKSIAFFYLLLISGIVSQVIYIDLEMNSSSAFANITIYGILVFSIIYLRALFAENFNNIEDK